MCAAETLELLRMFLEIRTGDVKSKLLYYALSFLHA
jgi:hypothetical protein